MTHVYLFHYTAYESTGQDGRVVIFWKSLREYEPKLKAFVKSVIKNIFIQSNTSIYLIVPSIGKKVIYMNRHRHIFKQFTFSDIDLFNLHRDVNFCNNYICMYRYVLYISTRIGKKLTGPTMHLASNLQVLSIYHEKIFRKKINYRREDAAVVIFPLKPTFSGLQTMPGL